MPACCWQLNKEIYMFLEKALVTQAAYVIVSTKVSTEISQGCSLKDQALIKLAGESLRLFWEADALSPHIIRANLQSFGLDDPSVFGAVIDRNNHAKAIETIGPVPLSDLCYMGLIARITAETHKTSFSDVVVMLDNKRIGYIDRYCVFYYETTPDFKTALGWIIATDGGHVRLIEDFNLDQVAQELLFEIKKNIGIKWLLYGVLKRFFLCGKTSCFDSIHTDTVNVLWQVAQRQLAQEL